MPPRLLDKLTDELLVVASDAVAAVAAEEQPLSGNAALRLLAWTVADAHGATVVMDTQCARKVGVRLDRQAQSVRAQLAAPSERAAEQRRELESGGRSASFVAQALADIDAKEQADSKAAREAAGLEKYIGFHELEELLPATAAAAPVLEAGDEEDLSPEGLRKSWEATPEGRYSFEEDLRSQGCYFPWVLVEDYHQEDCSIPPDLVKSLGPEAVQVLWEKLSDHKFVGERWWRDGLPWLVKIMLEELKIEHLNHEDDLNLEKEHARMAKESRQAAQAELEEAEDTIEALRAELQRAKGREEALHRVIRECRWG